MPLVFDSCPETYANGFARVRFVHLVALPEFVSSTLADGGQAALLIARCVALIVVAMLVVGALAIAFSKKDQRSETCLTVLRIIVRLFAARLTRTMIPRRRPLRRRPVLPFHGPQQTRGVAVPPPWPATRRTLSRGSHVALTWLSRASPSRAIDGTGHPRSP